jgi:hypothetical protein
MDVRRHTMPWKGNIAHLQHTELVSIYEASSWDEVDEIYSSVSQEAARLAGLKERNNALLIQTGLATKLIAYESRRYGISFVPGSDSSFRIGVGGFDETYKPLDRNPEIVQIGLRNPKYWDPVTIGNRVLGAHGVEYESLLPEFSEADVEIASGLLTDLLDGSFPHLIPTSLTHLIVHGSLEAESQQEYTEKYLALCTLASALEPVNSLE